RFSPQSLSAGHKLVAKLSETDAVGNARAPGVREHRTSPRLAWLTEIGYLSKEGPAKKRFQYRVASRATPLLASSDVALEAVGGWCFNGELSAWRTNSYWGPLRRAIVARDDRTALGSAYIVLRRRIGPAPLRDVAFITGMLCPSVGATETLE